MLSKKHWILLVIILFIQNKIKFEQESKGDFKKKQKCEKTEHNVQSIALCLKAESRREK